MDWVLDSSPTASCRPNQVGRTDFLPAGMDVRLLAPGPGPSCELPPVHSPLPGGCLYLFHSGANSHPPAPTRRFDGGRHGCRLCGRCSGCAGIFRSDVGARLSPSLSTRNWICQKPGASQFNPSISHHCLDVPGTGLWNDPRSFTVSGSAMAEIGTPSFLNAHRGWDDRDAHSYWPDSPSCLAASRRWFLAGSEGRRRPLSPAARDLRNGASAARRKS